MGFIEFMQNMLDGNVAIRSGRQCGKSWVSRWLAEHSADLQQPAPKPLMARRNGHGWERVHPSAHEAYSAPVRPYRAPRPERNSAAALQEAQARRDSRNLKRLRQRQEVVNGNSQ